MTSRARLGDGENARLARDPSGGRGRYRSAGLWFAKPPWPAGLLSVVRGGIDPPTSGFSDLSPLFQ